MVIRWLVEHGYGVPATFPEVAVLNVLVSHCVATCGS